MDRSVATGSIEAAVAGALSRIGNLVDRHWVTTEDGPHVQQPDFDMALIAALLESEEARGGPFAVARIGASFHALRDPGDSVFSASAAAVVWGEVAKHDMRPFSQSIREFVALTALAPVGNA
jgi:hypothetical protein